jgi:anti-sigma-K factor RskA
MRLSDEAVEALSREYALGTLHGGARRRFEQMLRTSPRVASAVESWQQRLAHLAPSVAPLQPSPALWSGLEDRLFGAPRAAPQRKGWFARWGLPSLGGAVAGAFVCVLVLQQQPQLIGRDTVPADTLPQSYVGLLSDASGQPVVLASSTRHGRLLSVKLLKPIAVPPGQVARLWALPADGRAPFLVAQVPASGKAALALPDTSEHLFSKVPRLGVRLEPEGQALAPPGPGAENFVASGACVKLW